MDIFKGWGGVQDATPASLQSLNGNNKWNVNKFQKDNHTILYIKKSIKVEIHAPSRFFGGDSPPLPRFKIKQRNKAEMDIFKGWDWVWDATPASL